MLEDFAKTLDQGLQYVLEISDLSPREKEILTARWMHDGKPKLLVEVAQERHVTRERIRSIEAKGLQKLRTRLADLEALFIEQDQLTTELGNLQARLSFLEAIRYKRTPESQAQASEEQP